MCSKQKDEVLLPDFSSCLLLRAAPGFLPHVEQLAHTISSSGPGVRVWQSSPILSFSLTLLFSLLVGFLIMTFLIWEGNEVLWFKQILLICRLHMGMKARDSERY